MNDSIIKLIQNNYWSGKDWYDQSIFNSYLFGTVDGIKQQMQSNQSYIFVCIPRASKIWNTEILKIYKFH